MGYDLNYCRDIPNEPSNIDENSAIQIEIEDVVEDNLEPNILLPVEEAKDQAAVENQDAKSIIDLNNNATDDEQLLQPEGRILYSGSQLWKTVVDSEDKVKILARLRDEDGKALFKIHICGLMVIIDAFWFVLCAVANFI